MAVLDKDEVSSEILRITLNRPNSLNALNGELLAGIADTVRSANGEYTVLIFEGAGRAFTAGADLDAAKEEGGENIDLFQDITRAVREFEGIVVGKLHGWVVGGGFEWTLSFDLRYAATDTTFKMTESEIGVTISNASTLLLPLTVGAGKARELVFTSREVSANEAERLGLIAGVYDDADLDEKVLSVAEDIVENKSRTALWLNKRGFNHAFPVEEVLEYEEVANLLCDELSGEIEW
ncbi:enoyl-CoA hydratase/isomerase family protein [Halomarina halobia]|uniref:Enoyl-CoA hydratase/isomerase family protein n=1 Tax=Halomarina halobia TaxID=3033386 RepID=A0ABD6AEH6_9EURY|nr:enoyl-CoA hydratase/isomerase family protein [Halomarina sp. PSR21]